jgi:hypothetical protein
MSEMADETLAFSVAEVTMQDWLAAVLLAKYEPLPAAAPRIQASHPLRMRDLPQPVKRNSVAPRPATAFAPNGVAGARTVYWLSLAAALALTLVF